MLQRREARFAILSYLHPSGRAMKKDLIICIKRIINVKWIHNIRKRGNFMNKVIYPYKTEWVLMFKNISDYLKQNLNLNN